MYFKCYSCDFRRYQRHEIAQPKFIVSTDVSLIGPIVWCLPEHALFNFLTKWGVNTLAYVTSILTLCPTLLDGKTFCTCLGTNLNEKNKSKVVDINRNVLQMLHSLMHVTVVMLIRKINVTKWHSKGLLWAGRQFNWVNRVVLA